MLFTHEELCCLREMLEDIRTAKGVGPGCFEWQLGDESIDMDDVITRIDDELANLDKALEKRQHLEA